MYLVTSDDPRELIERALRAMQAMGGESPTIAELAAKYEEAKRLAPSLQHHRFMMALVLKHIGSKRVNEITPGAVDTLRRDLASDVSAHTGRPLAPGTRNIAVKRLVAVLNWAVGERLITAHMLHRIQKEKVAKPPEFTLTEDELEELCAASPSPTFTAMIRVRFWTGARPTEVRELQWDRVDVQKPCLWLRDEDTKTGEPRMVPLPQPALDAILAQPRIPGCPYVFPSTSARRRGKPFTLARVCQWWLETLERADMKWPDGRRRTYHRLRAVWERNARLARVDYDERRAILGHASLEGHDAYVQVTTEDKLDASKRIEETVRRRGPKRHTERPPEDTAQPPDQAEPRPP